MTAVTLRTIVAHHHRRLRLLAGSLLLAGLAQAQLVVNTQTNLQHLAQSITGMGVQIINPQITCHAQGYGEFTYTGSLLGIDEGVLLTTGRLTEAVGPNNVENKSFQANTPGNTLLNVVTNRTTYDACKLEFDIIPAGDSLQFDFALGSEEYNEWVGSEYNDVFGFFISGPGITGDPGVGSNHNIARIPVTNQPVTINNVNAGSNQAYYYNNAGGQHIQYDGFTRNLTAVAVVQPCATYHLQLIVADASDRKFDSGVFIAEVKSNPVTMSAFTANGAPYLVEGCNNGHVRFARQTATPLPLTLQYYLSGTATNGTDYAAIGNVNPSVPKTIVIPANQTYVDQPITTVADNLNEDSELIRIILGNPNCPNAAALDTLEVLLLDTLIGTVQPVGPIICQGDSVQFHATPGLNYSWTPATDLSSTNSADPWASPTTTTQYRIEMTQGSCSRTVYRNVRVSQLALSAVVTRPLCNGGNNGAINLSIADGIAPYTYSWTGPNGFTANTQDLTGLVAGTYTVTVQDAACSRTQSYNVGQPAVLAVSLSPSLLVFGQNISCSGGSDGSINSAITGGTGPYTVQWSGPNGYAATTPNISGLGEGNYTVQVTDANGCTTGASASMAAASPLQATPGTITHSICYNDHLGSVNVIANGGAPPYTYTWNTTPVQTTATASGLSPGTYQVLVRDVYGCITSMTAVVNGPTQAFTVSLASRTNVLCRGNSTGSASVSAAGGTAPYTFQWNTSPVTNGNSISNRPAGTYTVTVTDANSCTATLPVTISQPAQALSGTISAQQNIACRGNSTGGATVQGQGGTGPYTYVWNTTPTVNGATISNRPAGTYTATITDVNGCQITVPVTLTQPAAVLSATIPTRTDALCFGSTNGTATAAGAGGTAPYTYSWNTTPVQTTATATGLAAGTYTVTVTDAASCVTTTNAVIGQPAVITITGTIVPALCQGAASGAVDATITGGTGAYQYAWSSGPGFSATTQDISGLNAGGYTLVVTDANNCTATRTFEVGQPGLFTVGAVLSNFNGVNVSCPSSNNGSIDLSVSGAQPPYNYVWTGPNGFTATTQDISGRPAGTYAVVITDANGCGTGASYTLTAPTPVTIQLTAGDHNGHAVSCQGGSDGSINATIAGGIAPYAKSWSGPNGFSSNVEDPSGLPAGTYTLQVTDANGCIATQSITLNAAPAIVVSAGAVTGQSCFGSANGQATMTVSGGTGPFTWNWSTLPAQHAATATGLIAGNYTVNVVDANGCTGSGTVNVPGPSAALTLSTTSTTNVLCHQGSTGSATVQASGGTAGYTYVWNTTPQQTGATATGLAAGSYTVQVTDANGCTASRVINISQPSAPLSAALLSRTNVTCFGANNGTASISVSGGSGAWSVQWNTAPVQTGATATGLPAGTWTATITDNNGCATALQFPVVISGPSAALAANVTPYAYTGGAHVSCVGSTDGSIHSNVSGGTAPYTYQWTHPNGTTSAGAHPSGLGIGTHALRVTDANGCQVQTSVTLVAPTGVTTSAAIVSAICHGDNSGSIQLTVNGGASPYGFAWTGPNGFTASTRNISALYAGVYFIHVTDANGCVTLNAYDVTEPGTFTFSSVLSQHGSDNISCADGADGGIDMTVTGGTMPYTYSWSSIAGAEGTTQDLNGLDAGTYFLVLTDNFGCQGLSTQVLTEPDPLTLMLSAQTYAGGYNVTCNGAPNGAITAVIGGGTPGYDPVWTGPSGYASTQQNITGLAPGTYQVTVTDDNGCTIPSNITLVGPSALQATLTVGSFAGGTGNSCAGANDGSAQLQVSGGTAPVGVSWSGPSGFTSSAWSISGLAPGTYTATITDGNGCSIVRQAVITAPAVLTASGVVPQFNGFGISCFGGSNGSIDLGVTGGSGTYVYAWTGPNAFVSSTQDVSAVMAGSYAVHITDANGCSTDVAFNITQPTALGTSGTVATAACQGSATGAVDLTTTGGVAPYAWAWGGPAAYSASTQDISNLFAGVYQVNVQDANGCAHVNTFNVGQPGMFSITAQLSQYAGGFQVSCAGASDGWIDATITGGTPNYNYFWTGPNAFSATTQDISGLAPGAYTLSMTDANGCGSSAQYQLSAPSPLAMGLAPSIYAGGSNTGCSGSADGSIDAVISGGVGPYTFVWTGPSGNMGTSEDLSGLEAGTYQVVATDAIGCTITRSITLSAPGGLSISAVAAVYPNHLHLTCHDSNDGMIDLTITGGTHPFQILWTGPDGGTANTEDIHGLPAGDFTVVVTDANGCSVSTLITLKAPLELLATVTAAQFSGGYGISCANGSNGSITTTVSGGTSPYTYAWSGPNGYVAQTADISALAAGTYSLTITDASGCTLQRQVVLTAPQPLVVGAVLSDAGFGFEVGCTGTDGSIDLSVSGGQPAYQYDWSGPNGYASQLQDPTNLIAGGYQVSVIDANGCTAQRSYELTGPDAFTTTVQAISNECDGTDDGQVLLDVQGGIQPYTFAWSGPNGFAANTEDIGALASGTYNVTITDAGGCSIDTVADIIAAAPILWDLYASQYGDVNIQCHGANTGVIGLTVQGGVQPLQIDWTGPNGYTFNGTELTALYAGSYQLTVTDDHGCQRDTTFVLVEPVQPLNASLLAAVQASGTNISCHGGSDGAIDAIVTGGTAPYTFDWRVGGVGFSTTQDISGLTAGIYELVITDTNACQVTLDITLTEPDSALQVDGTITDMNGANTSCAGATDGGITVVLSGGSPAYTMDWTGPNGFVSTNDTLTGLAAGHYVLSITDLNGCVLEQTFSVIAPEPLVLSLDALVQPSGNHISCAGLDDGRIEAQLTGGIEAYQLTWSGPDGFTSNALVVDQLAPGTYCLMVTDANGCSTQDCITLTEPSALSVSAAPTGATCGSPNGSVDATIVGGSQPFNTAWSSGQSTEDLTAVTQATYELVVTDVNGCMDSVTVVVTGTPGIEVDHTTTAPLCQASNEGAIDLTVVQGTAPFQFNWSDGPTAEDRTGLIGGVYSVEVGDDAGCTWTMDFVVEAPEALTADSTVSLYANGYEVSTYGGNDGSITVEPQGGTAPYNALWSTGATTLEVQGLTAGTYAVILTDASGCTLSMDFLLQNPTDIRVPTGFTPNGDGQNDAFIIQGIEGYPENQFTVLNRWGNVVYERLNYANDWRGENHEGGELANGTYFVVVRLGRTGTVIQNYVDLRR